MPSWNVHIAHVEHLFEKHRADDLGIADPNAFLFGNCVPDVYVGFMVPDVSMRIDYCLTHVAAMARIPVPDADWFWDHYVARRRPKNDAGVSLALGAWAHLVADRFYNKSFRGFCLVHDTQSGELLRKGKQADFELFGRSLQVSSQIRVTPELVQAARDFAPYSVAPDDVAKAVEVANAIAEHDATFHSERDGYQLLSAEWMFEVFDACDERLALWLAAWRSLEADGMRCLSADVRSRAGLAPAAPDDPDWDERLRR